MMIEEREQLLALLDHERKWCQDAEAQDADGNAVRYNDSSAAAWDITGALCRLFGWRRACELFKQLDRHINGRRAAKAWPARYSEVDSMAALQDYNDGTGTTFALLRDRIETMPVHQGNFHGTGALQKHEGPRSNADVG